MKIWIDTDIGSDVDDALTLAYAMRHPGLELVGVSTVFGDVELRSDIARALLALDNEKSVPIITGLATPITEGRHGLMFGHEGRGILEGRKPRMRSEETPDAKKRVQQLAEALERTQPDVLVAIGPLSNLGALAQAGLPLPPLAIMGGKLSDVILEGMIPAIPEWNWFCDPRAVQEVLRQEVKILPRIVPAEVTFRTALHPEDVARLGTGDALAQQLSILCNEWLSFLRDRSGGREPRVALHDPLTAATLVQADLCPFEDRRIRVDEGAASHSEEGPANICAATDVDNDALRLHLMDIWMGQRPGD